ARHPRELPDDKELPQPPGSYRKPVRRLVLLWAVRWPSPPGYRTWSSQTESTEDTSILAAERQSPEYQAEGWRLVSGRACGAEDVLSTRAFLSHPGGELQTVTHAA